MIYVIVPLGKEAKDVASWVVRVIMYTAGAMLGGALLALLLGLVGQGLHALFPGIGLQWAVGILGAGALLYALHEFQIIRLPNPQRGWLVPRSWQRSSLLFGNTLYGIALGMGIFTFIPFASFYILLSWEMAAGAISLQAAVLLGMIYGALRGIPAVLGGISTLRGVYPVPLNQWIAGHLGWWHAINGLALLLVGSFLVGSFFV